MGARYLIDLADVLRAAGVDVWEVSGWERRARSSGGYADGLPTSLMVHHTASPPHTDGARDVDYIISGSSVAPITNLYLDRKGTMWVCAAGATNTNGQGVDTWGGGVPANRMNEYAIAIEIANTGVGEPYPADQQDALMRACVAVCRAYSIPTHHVRAHFEWAPTRKIDPSGPSMWAASGKWEMDEFRDDIAAGLNPNPPTKPTIPTTSDEVDMIALDHNPGTPEWTALSWTGVELAHVFNGHADSVIRRAGVQRQTITDAELDAVIASSTTKTACPSAWVNTPRGAAWTAQRG